MKKIGIDTLFDFKFVSSPKYCNCGKYTAFVVQQADKEGNCYKGDIYLFDNSTKEISPLTSGGDAKSFFWGKNNKLVFSAMREEKDKKRAEGGEPLTVYYEINPHGGEAKKAFEIGFSVSQIEEYENGKYVLLAEVDTCLPDVSGMDEAAKSKAYEEYKNSDYSTLTDYPFWHNGGGFVSGKIGMVMLYDRQSGSLTIVTGEDVVVDSIDVKDDKVLYCAFPNNGLYTYGRDGVYIYDIATKETKCVLEADSLYLECACLLDGGVLVAATEGKEYGSEEYPDFYYASLEDCKLKLIAAYDGHVGIGLVGSDARLGGGITMKSDGDKCYFITTDDDSSYIQSIDKNGTLSQPLTPSGSCDSFDIKDGKIIYCGLYGNELAEIYCENERLSFFNDMSSYSVSTPEEHTFTDSDGVEIKGWALKPVDYDENKKYPAIVHVHGGPRTVFGSVFHHEMQLWANSGYFVLFCNPRGSDGKGSEFGYLSGKYGSIDYRDIMEFTDEMLKKYPAIDAKRVGVGGGSYGGFMTNWVIGHTDRFAAAVSQRSIANWVSFEHTTDIGLTFAKTQMNTTTQDDAPTMWSFSPLKYIYENGCKTPTLFIHSDHDYRCYMVEGLSMFTALKKLGCETKLCLFKDETHELSRSGKPKARVGRLTEIIGWFDKYLK